jgi:hypothetical protein
MANGATILKLGAFDPDDLQVISAQMQDAVLTVGNMKYLPHQQKLVLVANRFDWEEAERNTAPPYRRCLSGVQFARVRSVRSRKIRQDDKDAVLMLLAIDFKPGDLPAGEIILRFAGGGDLRIEVECVEAKLEDLGPQWATTVKPVHDASGAS